ncbi:phosphoribosylglycinamide formyltransferase [bacterium DOLZORAL124_38_8]|nr:MAG: phosphoribosylglycinamide formyltransferase [bacterium DOLZORAL124_38_8]
MKNQNIVFVGFRGAGKSRFGKEIAKLTHLPFVDLDTELEFVLGTDIESFAEKHGWQVLREIEQKVAHDFTRNFSGIVATGHATIENSKNLHNLKKTGVFGNLKPNFMQLRRHLMKEYRENDIPRVYPDLGIAQEIDQLWSQRKDIYAATADFELVPDLDNDNAEEEAQKMLEQISKDIIPDAAPKRRVAVFSSSNGTTFQGLLEAQKKGRIPNVEFVLFITDKPNCGALEKAQQAGIETIHVLEPEEDETREEYDRQLINLIREQNPDVILLAGWMRILSPLFCEQFGDTTLNVHPSLLPDYAGMMGDAIHKKVIENEDRYTGATIHKVSPEVDGGDIVVQRKVLVTETDSVEDLRRKVQAQEVLGFCEALEKKK